jgi:hypothetical protein
LALKRSIFMIIPVGLDRASSPIYLPPSHGSDWPLFLFYGCRTQPIFRSMESTLLLKSLRSYTEDWSDNWRNVKAIRSGKHGEHCRMYLKCSRSQTLFHIPGEDVKWEFQGEEGMDKLSSIGMG